MDNHNEDFKQNQEYYISYPNTIFRYNHNKHLNIEEIYLYAYLHTRRNFIHKTVLTNLNLIHEEIKFVSKKTVNIKRIIKNLISLKEKGFINFHDENDLQKRSKLVIDVITYHDLDNYGYSLIKYKTFDRVDNPLQFSILLYVNSVSWVKSEISYSEFAEKLYNYQNKLISDKTIREEINTMKKKGILIIEHGKYYCVSEDKNKIRQMINQYTANEDNLEEYEDVTSIPAPSELLMNIMGNKVLKKEASRLIDKLPKELKYEHYKWIKTYDHPYIEEIGTKLRLLPMANGGFDFTDWENKLQRELMENS